MPGFITPPIPVRQQRTPTKKELVHFSNTFALAEPLAHDLIPLLARGEREQTAVTKVLAEKATLPSARRTLPRLGSSSSLVTKSLAASPVGKSSLLCKMVDPVKQTTSEPEIKKFDTSQTASTAIADTKNTGIKSFDMQNREVDAVKAVTPIMAHPKSFGKEFQGQANINDNGQGGNGHSSDGTLTRGQKKKFNKANRQISNKSSVEGDNTRPPSSYKGDQQYPVGGAGYNTPGGRKNTAGKFRGDNKGCNEEGKYRSEESGRGGYGGGGYRGGGYNRSNRSNTLNENGPPRPYNQDNFRSMRGNPNKHFNDNAPPHPNARKGLPTDGYGTPAQHHASPAEFMGDYTPNGTWYPHQAPVFGPPPHMMLPNGMPPPFVPPGEHLIPLPIPPAHPGRKMVPLPEGRPVHTSQQGPAIVPPQGSVIVQPQGPTILPPPSRNPSLAAALQPLPSHLPPKPFTSPASGNLSAATTHAGPHTQPTPPTREPPHFTDPRPAHIRLESVMTTITAELETLKHRIRPGADPKIESADMTRYLDTCLRLCKDATHSSEQLLRENESMRRLIETAMHRSNEQTRASSVPARESRGGKIGSNTHSRNQSVAH